MEQEIYYLVLERLVQEFSGVGAIGGVATPLGAGPTGRVKYRSGNAKSEKQKRKELKNLNQKINQFNIISKIIKKTKFIL